jgi:LysR family transcriptional regulator, cell division regulator
MEQMGLGMIHVELRDLRVFSTVAKEGSITKAAQQLDYVQSNVTSRIQQLETELGTSLFYRHSRGVSLTSAGETLLQYANQVLHLCAEAEKAVRDRATPRGPLRIGSMETTAAVRLPAVLATYHRQYPEVDLSLQTGTTDDLIHAVLERDLDGAFIAGKIDHPELAQDTVVTEELVVISNSNEDLIDMFQDFRRRTLLVFRTGCSYRAKLEQWLSFEGIVPAKVMELGTLDGILGCVEAGLGISLLPKSVVMQKQHSAPLFLHEIPEQFGIVPTVFIRRQDALLTSAFREFLRIAKELSNP